MESNERISFSMTTLPSPNIKEGGLAKYIEISLSFYLVENSNAQVPAWKQTQNKEISSCSGSSNLMHYPLRSKHRNDKGYN